MHSVANMTDYYAQTEFAEKPVFVPPRKRGSKSSSRSSSEGLQMLGTANSSTPHTCPKLDLCSCKKFPQLIPQERAKSKPTTHSESMGYKPSSPSLKSIAYHKQSLKANIKSDDSDLNSDVSDCFHINDSGYADIELSNERSVLNSRSASSIGSCGGSYVTMTGTVKRGRTKGQTLDMKVQMSREELDELEHTILSQNIEDDNGCFCGLRKGLHVLLLSVALVPLVFLLSAGYSFYMGTMTWYNILIYFSEHKNVFHKIFISPLLIISYPFLISLTTIGLGIYSAVIQVSWHFDSWKEEFQDLEKGFYGWLCGIMNLEDCAPYEVVILTEVLPPSEKEKQSKQPLADTAL